jgi:hypothetical protein
MADLYLCPVCRWRGRDYEDLVEHAEREHGHRSDDPACTCRVCNPEDA